MAATFFFPLGVILSGGEAYVWEVTGVREAFGERVLVYSTWGVAVLSAFIALLALVTVFLFKTRIRQIRLCVFNGCLMIGFYAFFLFFFFYVVKGQHPEAVLNVKIALALPLISLVLDYLAIRNIGADEALIRSLNRLR
jgi:hypothetical protein